MKRIALLLVFAFGLIVVALIRPDYVSVLSVLGSIVLLQLVLIFSLVYYPVTEYITKTEWRERESPNSIRHCINLYLEKQARFHLADGSVLEGELVGRSDSKGTFSFKIGDEQYQTLAQGEIKRIETIGDQNTPPFVLEWEEGTPLQAPRTC